jgi:uncharacterized protein (TIGR00369 family)
VRNADRRSANLSRMVIDPVVEAVERGGGFHRLLGVKVVALGEGTASVELPAGERTSNPFGTQSGGALYGLADLAAAGAVASAFRAELAQTRSLVRDATVTFTRAARGLVRAHARVDSPLPELRAALETDGRVVIPVVIDLAGPDEESLAHVELRWDLKRVTA